MTPPTREGPEQAADDEASGPAHGTTVLSTVGPLEVRLGGGSERATAWISGEILLDNADQLLEVLSQAVLAGRAGLDLDTTAVTFTDSSGLNALLELRLRALESGHLLTLRPGARMGRLLDLTGTRDLFPPSSAGTIPDAGQHHGS
ncbi:STAS domain-containing protein [Kitasatospora sp. NPDC002040]|uniref:STAS domain-containing protein n=1 Tax=Kitasatospora sp. NPDC002040 TaxID=3154661 RepID=UPI00332F2463